MDFRGEMQAFFDRMTVAYRAGDTVACADMWTENAVIFSSFGPPLAGRGAIEAAHREWTAEGAGADKVLQVSDAAVHGDMAWCLIRYAEEGESGVSLNVLERQADGTWLIRLTSLNSDFTGSD